MRLFLRLFSASALALLLGCATTAETAAGASKDKPKTERRCWRARVTGSHLTKTYCEGEAPPVGTMSGEEFTNERLRGVHPGQGSK